MATIFSFFSGAGFLDLGFENAGFNIAFVNEYHAPFMDAYKYSRRHMNHTEPSFGYYLNSIDEFIGQGELSSKLKNLVHSVKEANELVGFIGGPPCPDFSVGGKNKGAAGDNGRLTNSYIETIIEHNPDFFLFENVKGLWRTASHRVFYEKMKNKLKQHGYILTEKLVNSIQFGVPQDRYRILLFGIKDKNIEKYLVTCTIQQKEIPTALFDWDANTLYSLEESLYNNAWPDCDSFKDDIKRTKPSGVIRELTVEHWFKRNNVTKHPNSNHFFNPKSAKFNQIDEGDVSKKSFKRLHRWRYSPTAAYGNNEVHLHPYKARRLSAAEALSIQSLPKEFVLPPNMTLSNMFKTIGNGVPYNMAYSVAQTIMEFLSVIQKKSSTPQFLSNVPTEEMEPDKHITQ